MTESYGVLTVGSVTSGTVAVGQQVTGAGVASLTGIEDNLSGSGAGSTWLVNNAQRVAGDIAMTATPLSVTYNSVVGATANRDYFEVQPNGDFGYDYNPGSVSYMGGTAAATLGLTQASGALDSTSSGVPDVGRRVHEQPHSEREQPVRLRFKQRGRNLRGKTLNIWAI